MKVCTIYLRTTYHQAKMINSEDPVEIMRFYEEQLTAQRGMLSYAIESLVEKKEDLEKAVKRVENRNYELNQISYRTFHDMKEPMVALVGLIHMIRLETKSESVNVLLNMAEASIKRLDNFSLSLAEYVSVIQKNITKKKFKLRYQIDETIFSLRDWEGYDKVNIVVEDLTNSMDQEIEFDPDILSVILKNLITNAIRFRDVEKDSFIRIKYKAKKDSLLILIQDNGMGMNQHVHQKVTEMFYRGTNESKGSGLGLYMTKILLENCDGRLKIQSKEGVGTDVFIQLSL